MKNKKIIIIIIFIFLIIILAVFSFFINNKKSNNTNNNNINKEDVLKNNNSQVIKEALNDKIINVSDINKNDHYIGDLNSAVKLIVYCDYTNTYCANLNNTLKVVKDKFSPNIIIAYRHFLVGDDDLPLVSAIASECADEQGNFWEMNEKLYQLSKNSELTKENIQKITNEISLNSDQFDNCLNSNKYVDKINKQIVNANSYGVIGAPTIFINKEILPGDYPFEDFVDSTGKNRQGLSSIIKKYLN